MQTTITRPRGTLVAVVLAALAIAILAATPAGALTNKATNVATTNTRTAPKVVIQLPEGRFVPDLVVTKTSNVKYTWGWVTGTVYYNKAETRSMRTYSYAAMAAGAICAVFGPETVGAACAIGAVAIGQWNYVAGNAYAAGQCVKIKLPIMIAYQYSGGYCT